jgi:hypothetical protein
VRRRVGVQAPPRHLCREDLRPLPPSVSRRLSPLPSRACPPLPPPHSPVAVVGSSGYRNLAGEFLSHAGSGRVVGSGGRTYIAAPASPLSPGTRCCPRCWLKQGLFLKKNHHIAGWVVGGPDGYRWAGKHAVGDKRITFLTETLSKLRFFPSTLPI